MLKGGFLIAAMVGIDTRATMDLDATLKNIAATKEKLQMMFKEIINIEVEDSVSFLFNSLEEIRESDEYRGYRISLKACFQTISVPLKIDITVGDKITPKEVEYKFKLLLEDRYISVYAYNLETVLAEKLETIISRGDLNTRSRDYYDVYVLTKLQSENINFDYLHKALIATSQKRASYETVKNYKKIIDEIIKSSNMNIHWSNYQKNFEYAKGITFEETCLSVKEMLDKIF